MQLLLALLLTASPVILFLGLIKPTLFKRWLGDQAKRSSIVGLSLALFVGSVTANGVLYPQTLVTEQAETVITPEPEETMPIPVLPKETPQAEDWTEPDENTVPKNNAIERTPSIETPQSEPEEEPESELEPAPEPEAPSSPTYYNCSEDKYNCGDFSTCSEVMSVFNTCSNDINGLDGDDDGVPCESLCE